MIEKSIGAAVVKKWDEKTSDEKIETLREVFSNKRYLVKRVARLEEEIRKFKEHNHVDGKVVIPASFREYDTDCAEIGFDPLR